MKYLKYFESMYNVGNYIVLLNGNIIGKIINIEPSVGNNGYNTEVIIENKLITIFLYYENIKRLATPQEIKEYEIKKQQIKYNL